MKKKCQYSKCGKEFTPNKPRQQYCSDIHRVYANREKPNKPAKRPVEPPAKKTVATTPLATPKNLDELKALCPKELTGLDRSNWISIERQKYNI